MPATIPISTAAVLRDVNTYLTTTHNGKKQVVVLSGASVPVGMGPMKELEKQLKTGGHLVAWLDVSSLIESDGHLSASAMTTWLNGIISAGAASCPNVTRPTLVGGIARQVMLIAEYLCDRCRPNAWPVILVRGFDDLSEDHLYQVEQDILPKLLYRGCIRLVIGCRHGQTIHGVQLRNSKRVVEVEKALSTRQQFAELESRSFLSCIRFRPQSLGQD